MRSGHGILFLLQSGNEHRWDLPVSEQGSLTDPSACEAREARSLLLLEPRA